MLLLWVTLLFLHQGYTLVPVTTVPLGESATFTCALPYTDYSSRQLYWFKQNAGETLTLIVKLLRSAKPESAPEFSDSRLEVKSDNNLSTLTIRRTIPEDEGMYHCLITERYGHPEWSGTYLLLKEKTASPEVFALVIAIVCLVISVIGNIVFLCCQTSKCKGIENPTGQARYDNSSQPVHDM
ncbi:T cell receptor beta variable 7-7, partial [Dissostichus eleginoides]